ncbi:hypothetical protein GGI25_004194 [Coemansia spiralis]|uniref:RING-type domain-containing protein n=2 Tax=Coemansia TaxID=4863 RepID=A0A9W8G0S5_9FUNG|nr:hypothetical protein EDC05_004173 [Coemansia umbellata]KAJ2674807.1 hypothetical protein GGI25_004194 [Coemansia spiralis]
MAAVEPQRAAETPAPIFNPTVTQHGTKKLELHIELQESPIVVRPAQHATIRGHLVLVSRSVQQLRGPAKATLVGTKHLENIQQMGSVGSAKRTIVKREMQLDIPGELVVGTYRVPFEFVVEDPVPSISVPRCTIEYQVSALVERAARLRLGHAVRATQVVEVARVPDDDTSGVVRGVGTLGSSRNGTGMLPYRVTMDKSVAAPGDKIKFTLEVFPTNTTGMSPMELVMLERVVAQAHSKDSDTEEPSDTSYSTADLHEMPPTYQLVDAPRLLANNKISVTSYKVQAKLVQRVCYLADHDLVADTDDSVYLFWTKRTICEIVKPISLDVSRVTEETVRVEWTGEVPPVQTDVQTSDIQVRYDVFVDFFPRDAGKMKEMVKRVSNRRLSAKLPLRIAPLKLLATGISFPHPTSHSFAFSVISVPQTANGLCIVCYEALLKPRQLAIIVQIKQPAVLSCGYVFHFDCIAQWFSRSAQTSCLLCHKHYYDAPLVLYTDAEEPSDGLSELFDSLVLTPPTNDNDGMELAVMELFERGRTWLEKRVEKLNKKLRAVKQRNSGYDATIDRLESLLEAHRPHIASLQKALEAKKDIIGRFEYRY